MMNPSEKTGWAIVTMIAMAVSLALGALFVWLIGWVPIALGVGWFVLCILLSIPKYRKERELIYLLPEGESLQASRAQVDEAAGIARRAGVDEEFIKDIYHRNGILSQYMPPK